MSTNSTIDFVDTFIDHREPLWLHIWLTESLGIIFINIITIIIFSVNRQAFGRVVCLLTNLAVADLMYGVSVTSVTFLELNAIPWPEDDVQRYYQIRAILVAFVIAFSGASALSIFLVAIDRFAAIFLPFRYRVAEPKVYIFAIVTCWCCSISVGFAQIFTSAKDIYILIYFYASSISFGLLAIITLYTAIFIKLRSQNQSMADNRTAQVAQQRERNMAYTSMTVTFCSNQLTWLPIGIVFALSRSASQRIAMEIFAISLMFQALNSFINPIIYAFKMRVFRKELVRLLCRCHHQIEANNANVNA